MTRLAIALGGNALIRRGEPGSTEVQRRNLVAAARGLVTLAEGSRAEIVVTHGNGPQVGFLAIGAEMASSARDGGVALFLEGDLGSRFLFPRGGAADFLVEGFFEGRIKHPICARLGRLASPVCEKQPRAARLVRTRIYAVRNTMMPARRKPRPSVKA